MNTENNILSTHETTSLLLIGEIKYYPHLYFVAFQKDHHACPKKLVLTLVNHIQIQETYS